MRYQVKTIPGFPNYTIDTNGIVRNVVSGKALKPVITTYGYSVVTLCYLKKRWNVRVHKLVSFAFLGTSNGLYTLHKNNIPHDNRVENLYLGTQKQNIQDQITAGTFVRGEKNGRAKLSIHQVKRIKFLYFDLARPMRDLARIFGVSRSAIQAILSGRTWQHIV